MSSNQESMSQLERTEQLTILTPQRDVDTDASSIITQLPAYVSRDPRATSPAPSYRTLDPVAARSNPPFLSLPTRQVRLRDTLTKEEREKPLMPAKEENRFHCGSLRTKKRIFSKYSVSQSWLDVRFVEYIERFRGADPGKALAETIAILTLLLQYGANKNGSASSTRTPDNTPILVALPMYRKCEDIAEWLVAQGADINFEDSNGHTPLYYAIRWSSDTIVDLFLDHGANVNAKSPLVSAIEKERINVCQKLLLKGADVNAKDSRGWTPLITAIKKGHFEFCQELISKGANIDAEDSRGLTALVTAIRSGATELSQELISMGANVNARDPWTGLTPLHAALRFKASSDELRVMLLDRGAEINSKDSYGSQCAILHDAVCHTTYHVVEDIINRGANVQIKNRFGKTAIFFALDRDDRILKSLFDAGLAVNDADVDGNTVLHHMCKGNYMDRNLQTLLKQMPDLCIANSKGETPIHLALMSNATLANDDALLAMLKHDPDAFRTELVNTSTRLNTVSQSRLKNASSKLLFELRKNGLGQLIDDCLYA